MCSKSTDKCQVEHTSICFFLFHHSPLVIIIIISVVRLNNTQGSLLFACWARYSHPGVVQRIFLSYAAGNPNAEDYVEHKDSTVNCRAIIGCCRGYRYSVFVGNLQPNHHAIVCRVNCHVCQRRQVCR